VFVSSTFTDLQEERQAAVSAILKSGHIPAGMELFTAGDKSQWETIKRWIDESDIYVLILGGRYGSIEEESGLSYTELEYNYALETGKPLFSIVISEDYLKDKVKEKGIEVIEQENPQLLKAFRKTVTSYMVSFFKSMTEIRLAIMENLPEIALGRDLSGWVPGSSIPDVSGLINEISKLNEENGRLKREFEQLQTKIKHSNTTVNIDDFETIERVFSSKIVHMNPNEMGFRTITALILLDKIKSNLIQGQKMRKVSFDNDGRELKGIEGLISLLSIYGLVDIHVVENSLELLSKYTLSKKGLDFLAYLDAKSCLAERVPE